MTSVKWIATYACLGGLSWFGAAFAQSPQGVLVNQQKRADEIC
jgi:hypothetical protein